MHDEFKCEIRGRVTNRVTNRFYTTKRQGDVRDGGGILEIDVENLFKIENVARLYNLIFIFLNY